MTIILRNLGKIALGQLCCIIFLLTIMFALYQHIKSCRIKAEAFDMALQFAHDISQTPGAQLLQDSVQDLH
jgi:hypothetical protein